MLTTKFDLSIVPARGPFLRVSSRLTVVVAEYQMLTPVQSTQDCIWIVAEHEISKMIDIIVSGYSLVPLQYQHFVHFVHVFERAIAVLDYVLVMEVSVGCEIGHKIP